MHNDESVNQRSCRQRPRTADRDQSHGNLKNRNSWNLCSPTSVNEAFILFHDSRACVPEIEEDTMLCEPGVVTTLFTRVCRTNEGET